MNNSHTPVIQKSSIAKTSLRAVCFCITLIFGTTAQAETTAGYPGDIPQFIESAESAGIVHRYEGPWEYFVGGGVAVLDCNGDYKPDLFFAGGENNASLFINHSETAGDLQFQQKDNYSTVAHTNVTGAYPLDIDNDGNMDLAVMRVGRNRLLRGNGDCTFDHAYEPFKLTTDSSWTTAFSANFDPAVTYPSLIFGNYVDRTAPGSPWGTCDDHDLYRPDQSTSSSDESNDPIYTEPLKLSPGHCALSMLFTDWNRSGQSALRITNDRQYHRGGEEQLWHFDAGAQPRQYSRREGWQKVVIWGMGIASADLNADGYPEYALTSMGDTKLQQLEFEAFEENGWPQYRDIAYENNATAHRPYTGTDLKPSTGWHAEFDDVNNDGLLDLFIAKGNVEQMPDFASTDPDNLLLGKHNGGFHEAGLEAGIALPRRGRGGAVVDLNLDGALDLVVVNRDSNVSLFRNNGAIYKDRTRLSGNWLQIKLHQHGINRNAVGAKVSVKSGNTTRTRTIQVGGGHASGESGFIHIGLGVAERASIRVQWPDGQWSAAYRAFANNFLIIERNSIDPKYWYPE